MQIEEVIKFIGEKVVQGFCVTIGTTCAVEFVKKITKKDKKKNKNKNKKKKLPLKKKLIA